MARKKKVPGPIVPLPIHGRIEYDRETPVITRPWRPSFETVYLDLASSLARRGTCYRLKVGCVIASEDHRRVLSIGYNGNAAGLPNACDSSEPGACGCIHAEMNAIVHCTEPRSTAKLVYCTDSPCALCAKLLIQLGGVKAVFYRRAYRLTTGIDTLQAAGIAVGHLPDTDGG